MNDELKNKLVIFNRVLNEIPEIKYVGDVVLRQTTQEVDLSEGLQIGNKLGEVLIRYRKITGIGRGLAAPQIGIGKSVFVTFVDEKVKIFINPKIIEKSEETNFYKELCLSCGILAADVQRSEWIKLKWMDESGVSKEEKIDGFLARLYQHEEAHLRGLVNIDESYSGGIEFATFDPLKEQLRKTKY